MANKHEIMTTTGGNPVANNQNSVPAGPRGPLSITREIVPRLSPGEVKGKFLAARS